MADTFVNLVDLFERSCAKYADRPLYGTKTPAGWVWTSYREMKEMSDHCRSGLAALGVTKGDRVAIIARNRVEWVAAAFACYGVEAAFVPLYEQQLPSEWQFILADCGAKVLFVSDAAVEAKLQGVLGNLPALEHVVFLEHPVDDRHSWLALLREGERSPVSASMPAPESVANFVYTSGTTGKPKGVLLSHRNIASNVSAVHSVFTFDPEDRSLSFLPWAHAYGQIGEVYGLLSMGSSIALNDAIENLLANIAEVKPTILFAVPRIFNRLYEAVNGQISSRPSFLQRIIRTGIQGAIRRAHGGTPTPVEKVDLAFDEAIVFRKIRHMFGGRLKYAISASATLGRDVADFIDAVGLPVFEGYGLTETSPIVAVNFPGMRRVGSVGHVIPGVRIAVDTTVGNVPGEGEIIVYGPNVMMGYHNRPEENAKALTADGGLRTGDIGYVDADNYLFVTGRIKEQYKLENGKYVMPSPLEEEIKLSPYLKNAFLYGDGRPFNVALVVVDEDAVKRWAAEELHEIPADVTTDERVRALIRSELELRAQGFKGFEKPLDFVLTREDFTIENGLLTPSLKLKRREVLARYKPLLDALYAKRAAMPAVAQAAHAH